MHVDLHALGTEFEVPVFIVQGQGDLRAPPDTAKAYFDEITAPEKQFLLAPRTGHEPSTISMDLIFGVLVEKVRPLCR
jgi:pimeloyl-ACP methyl ester carboxylesterase